MEWKKASASITLPSFDCSVRNNVNTAHMRWLDGRKGNETQGPVVDSISTPFRGHCHSFQDTAEIEIYRHTITQFHIPASCKSYLIPRLLSPVRGSFNTLSVSCNYHDSLLLQ